MFRLPLLTFTATNDEFRPRFYLEGFFLFGRPLCAYVRARARRSEAAAAVRNSGFVAK